LTIIRPTTINARFSQPVGLGGEKLWLCPTLGGDRLDLSGNGNHGTYNGGMGTVADKYKGSRAYKLDGSNDDLDCNNTISTSSNLLSVSSWFNASSLPTVSGETRTLVSKGNASRLTPFDLNFRGTGTATLLRFFTYSQSTSLKGITTYIANTIDTSYWHHVCGTYDNKTFRLYVDGNQVATSAWAGGLFDTSEDVRIGSITIDGIAQRYFSGLQDDVRIFNRAITPSEVKHLASKRGVLGSARQPYDPLKRTVVRVPAAIPAATKVGSIKKPTTIIKPSYQAGYARNASESENPDLWDGLVGAWMPSLGVTGDTLRDVSGNGNHGTLTNMDAATDWVATSKGLALDFDGSDDYVELSALDITDFKSISVFQVAKKNVAGTLRSISINHSNNDDIAIYWGSGNSLVRVDSGIAYEVGFPANANESMIVGLVFDGSLLSCYKNGKKVGSISAQFSFSTASGSLRIGSHASGAANFFNGVVSSTYIYNRALSPQEIKQLYVDSLAPFRKKQRVSVAVPAAVAPSATYHPLRSLAHPLEQ